MKNLSTIAAIATPLGVGGIGIIRISGSLAREIVNEIFFTTQYTTIFDMRGYTCAYGRVFDEEGDIDEAVVTVFHAPRSYTGEDVVEIASHGGVYILNRILRACCKNGAVCAQAGEFTKRAFLNGKLDLTQAEAVVDLIAAQGKQAAQAALTAKDGALYRKLNEISDTLVKFAAHLAAWIDYPEEDIVEINQTDLLDGLKACRDRLSALISSYDTGRIVREGIETVIAGRPNAGKSTLMNYLSGYTRSIVTDIAGTTRDIVTDTVRLGDVVMHLSDTAGIRSSHDLIEKTGVSMALDKLAGAQLVLAVFDGAQPLEQDDIQVISLCKELKAIALINKTDLPQRIDLQQLQAHFSSVLTISAKNGEGIEALKDKITELFELGNFDSAAATLANERQYQGASSALFAIEEGIEALSIGVSYDAVCVCIEHAVEHILTLTGKRASEEVVNQVFSRFCVGK